MAKDGLVESTTTTDKSIEGSGVEGQKSADTVGEESKPDTTEEPNIPTFDKEGSTCVVTLRDGPKRVYFRDGKEIGVENAG